MNPDLFVELVGKLVIAACGIVIGSWLFRESRRSHDRVMLHWSVMFLSAAGYLFGAFIVLGWGDAAVLTRMHYWVALVAVLPGALAATLLMLPLPAQVGDPLSLYMPLAILAGLSIPVITGSVSPGLPNEEYLFSAPVMSICVNTMIGAGILSVAILTYLSLRLRNVFYLALALAFLLITMGGRWVGGGLLNLAVGQLIVLLGYVLFYYVFARLIRVG